MGEWDRIGEVAREPGGHEADHGAEAFKGAEAPRLALVGAFVVDA